MQNITISGIRNMSIRLKFRMEKYQYDVALTRIVTVQFYRFFFFFVGITIPAGIALWAERQIRKPSTQYAAELF